MNLSEFLSKVDLVLSAMSQEEMAAFIHDMARTLPDRERAAFFSRLDRIKKKERDMRQLSMEIAQRFLNATRK